MRKHFLGISFAGTLIVLLGGLVAATIAAIIIMNLFNTMNTQPYITVSDAYYVNSSKFLHFHVLFYNVGRSSETLKEIYIYIPTNTSPPSHIIVEVRSNGDGEGEVLIDRTPIGKAEFNPQTRRLDPSGGSLNVVIMIDLTQTNINTNNLGEEILGIAVFSRDTVPIIFRKI